MGDGDGAVDAAAALLEALEGDGAVGEVHAVAGEGEGLADAASGEVQEVAEGADLAGRGVGRFEERPALVRRQVLAVAPLVKEFSGHCCAPFLCFYHASATSAASGAAYFGLKGIFSYRLGDQTGEICNRMSNSAANALALIVYN